MSSLWFGFIIDLASSLIQTSQVVDHLQSANCKLVLGRWFGFTPESQTISWSKRSQKKIVLHLGSSFSVRPLPPNPKEQMMQFEINLDFIFSYQFPVNPQKFEGWSLAEWGCLMLLMAYGESFFLGGFHIYLLVILNTSLLPCPVAMQCRPLGLQRSPRWCKPQDRWDLRLASKLGPRGTAYSICMCICIYIYTGSCLNTTMDSEASQGSTCKIGVIPL